MIQSILIKSLENNTPVLIIYQKGDKITKRKIQVTAIEETSISAYCFLRHQSRKFKIEQILAASFINGSDAQG